MSPLKITAHLSAPVVNPPMLDSLLEQAAIRRAAGGLRYIGGYEPGSVAIPVERRTVAGYAWPVPCCSSPIHRPDFHTVGHVSRRMDVNPLVMRESARTVHHTNMGEYKSHRLPVHQQHADRVVWFAVGDRAGVERLLAEVPAIGKKTSIGYGVVSRWTVESVEQDWSWFAPAGAGEMLMRPLPSTLDLQLAQRLSMARGGRDYFGGLVPPYWDTRTFADGVWPC